MMNFISKLFKKDTSSSSSRLSPKDVKSGDEILIEWDKAMYGFANVLSVNNDTLTKKLLLEINWDTKNDEDDIQKIIVSYDSKMLRNFHLLNQCSLNNENHLQTQLKNALKDENYTKVAEIQEKINKINNA